jgi:hypothetical protein
MQEYDVKFMDGMMEMYATNVIADNTYAEVDSEGKMFQLLLEILDHKKDATAIDILDSTITSANGNVKPKIMIKGWRLLIMWKDGLTSWEKLKDLNVSNFVEHSEYALANILRRSQHLNGGYLTHCISTTILSQRCRSVGYQSWIPRNSQ